VKKSCQKGYWTLVQVFGFCSNLQGNYEGEETDTEGKKIRVVLMRRIDFEAYAGRSKRLPYNCGQRHNPG